MIDDLLEIADHLARRDIGRPKQVSMRRAVSTAYYALFHAVAEAFADQIVGRQASWDVYSPVYRFPDHGVVKKRLLSLSDDPIRQVAVTFATLYEHRMSADYDPAPFRLGRAQVLDLVDRARQSVEAVRKLRPKQRLSIAVAFLAKNRPA